MSYEDNPLALDEVPIEELGLSKRTIYLVKQAGITSIGDLLDFFARGAEAMITVQGRFLDAMYAEVKPKLEEQGWFKYKSPLKSLPFTYDFEELWDYDQPAATEEKFRQRLTSIASANEADYRLQLLTQIARAQGLQRKFEQAHNTLNSVEAQLRDDLPVVRIRYLLERGRVYNSSNAKEQARPFFLQALELAQAHREDFYAVDAAHMMAIVEPPDEQMAWNLKALELAEASSDPRARKWLGSLYNNIGWTYHDLGQYEQALNMFEKALAWRETQGKEKETRIAKWCIARVLRSLNRIPEALAILRELEPFADGYTYEELGECLLLQGKQDEAQSYFARAHEILSQDEWLVANEAPRLERLRELARV